jgi:hypothetical protein
MESTWVESLTLPSDCAPRVPLAPAVSIDARATALLFCLLCAPSVPAPFGLGLSGSRGDFCRIQHAASNPSSLPDIRQAESFAVGRHELLAEERVLRCGERRVAGDQCARVAAGVAEEFEVAHEIGDAEGGQS